MGLFDLFGFLGWCRTRPVCPRCRQAAEGLYEWQGRPVCMTCFTDLKKRRDDLVLRRQREEEARARLAHRQKFIKGQDESER